MTDKSMNSSEILPSSEKLPLRENATPMDESIYKEAKDYDELREETTNNGLDDGNHGLTVKEAARWRMAALVVSWLSILIIAILAAISFGVSIKTHSAAAYGFGFDCVLDISISVIVIWRFYGSVGTLYSAEREKISLTFLGIVFTLASISIIARAIVNFVSQTHTIPDTSLYMLAAVSGSLCLVLAIIKFIIASKLESRSLRTDGYGSLAGSILGFSIFLSTHLIKYNRDIWFFDVLIAIAVGLFFGIYGARILLEILLESTFQTQIIGFCCCCLQKKNDSSNVI